MTFLQHQHSLSLVDLNPKYPHDEQVYDDEEHLIIKQAFQSPCNRCHRKITYFHRYYYKCDQCNYLLHESCAELPIQLEHTSHIAHTLTLFLDESHMKCYMCKSSHRFNHLCYRCSQCSFNICLDCGLDRVQYHSIYHPCHKHPLIPFYRHKKIFTECDACGNVYNGVLYHCVTCFHYFVHEECVLQPKRLLIQDCTHGEFFHAHQLILTYSFPETEQQARFFPACRVCDDSFSNYENRWVYKCDKCRYYVHLHCVSLRRHEPSNSGMDKITSKNYEDDPNVVHLPLSDRTCNLLKDIFLKESNKTIITHDSHEHPLTLVDTRCNDIIITSTNKVEDLCNGCVRPIMETPFYKCTYGCDFVLHDWCTRWPAEFKDRGGTRHTLTLSPKGLHKQIPGLFYCFECNHFRNGFAYSKGDHCYMDVACALIPSKITHPSHPHHLLHKTPNRSGHKEYCRMCLSDFTFWEMSFSCFICRFHLHVGCAMLLPTTIRHKYDKHPMTLSYRPIENHDGDYFCEVCEDELNPHISFYHCHDCDQSMHTTCAPLIIPQNIIQKHYFSEDRKIKCGGSYKTKDHQHPLSLFKFQRNSIDCIKCNRTIWDGFVFLKCLQCEFAIHLTCSSGLFWK